MNAALPKIVPGLFAGTPKPEAPHEAIDCGGCAPPVIVESERQADQRIADELRARNYAAACRACTQDED